MADTIPTPGRLIAIDGTRGKGTLAAAEALREALAAAGVAAVISRFDASGLFGELAAARGDRLLSPRTLALVYAADLAFRLRWEIRPVLEAGRVVIAAPYVETAVAVGAAAGLDEAWTRELLRFAPKPHHRGRAEERKPGRGWKARLDRGYAEYVAAMLGETAPELTDKAARRTARALLERRAGRAVPALSARGIAGLVTATIRSQSAAPRRSASRPRTARS